MFRKYTYKKKKQKVLENRCKMYLYGLGVSLNENITIKDLLNHHIEMTKNGRFNEEKYEANLNKLCAFIFDNERCIMWHGFRVFPYILHANKSQKEKILSGEDLELTKKYCNDLYGKTTLYTSKDFFLIRFIEELEEYYSITYGKPYFIDIEWLINNSHKCKVDDIPINEMEASELLRK